MLAAANGHLTCVAELLEQGADVNEKRTVGGYALKSVLPVFASQCAHFKIGTSHRLTVQTQPVLTYLWPYGHGIHPLDKTKVKTESKMDF